jgi:hypothetical protein
LAVRGDDTVAQVISTTAYGFGLAALRWRLGTIWPLVVLHAGDNFVQLRSPGAAALWWQALVALFVVGYGWWLIRRLSPRTAVSTAGPQWSSESAPE